MGKTLYTDPVPGSAATAAEVNAVFSSLATASATIDGGNIREEGLVNRSFPAESLVSTKVYIQGKPLPSTNFTSVAWQTLTIGATTFQTLGIVLAANERLRIDWSFELYSNHLAVSAAAGYGLTVGDTLSHSLWYTFNGGALTEFAETRQVVRSVSGSHASCDGFHEVTTPGTYTFELRGKVSAGAANMAEAQMLVRLFKRCS